MTTSETRRFRQLFGGRPGDTDIATLARAAAREGYAVLPIEPGGKRPLCTLTERQARQADKEAAHAARDAGKRSWERARHACGIAHATTDEKVAHRVFKRLAATHPGLNMAIDVLQSRVLVVDADTAAELASWTTFLARQEGIDELIQAAPTVRSPGQRDEEGRWKHSDGGHYWYLLPDDVDWGDLAGTTSIPVGTHREHKAQLKVTGYVLVPPSTRDEGAYVMESDVAWAPDWMIQLVQEQIEERRENRIRSREAVEDADDSIRAALAAVEWDAILEPLGWSDTGKASRCGCPEWTAPGDHASPKSATAHDPGCVDFETEDGFIHVWTDNPPGRLADAGTKTFSKIQFLAWHEFDGDDGAAMRELGIETGGADERRDMDDWARQLGEQIREKKEKKEKAPAADEDDEEDEGEGSGEGDGEHGTSWWFKDLGPVLSGENPEPEPEVLAREDGPKLFYPGKVNGLIGESESGKSWIALAAVAEQLRAGHPVCYFDFEDSAPGIVTRLRSLGVADELMHPDAELFGYIGPEESLHKMARFDFADALTFRDWSLIVFDGVNAAMTQVGLDLISNTDATRFFTDVTRPASITGATVLTIDHIPKNQENRTKGGIGAQAKRATITGSCIAVSVEEPFARGRSGRLLLSVDKDRPGYVRAAANAVQDWATAVVSANSDGTLSIVFEEPEVVTKAGIRDDEEHRTRLAIMSYLKRMHDEYGPNVDFSKTTVEENVPGNAERIRKCLAWLVTAGYVNLRIQGRAHRHSFAQDYPEDPSEIDLGADDAPF